MNSRAVLGSLASATIMVAVIVLLVAFSDHTQVQGNSTRQLMVLVASSGGGFVAGLVFALTARSEVQSVADIFLRFLKTKSASQG